MTNITQVTISRLRASGEIQYIRDQSLTGFGIKVTARGKASYFAEARVRGGRSVRKTIGRVDLIPLDDAKVEARALLLELSRGIDVARIPPTPPPQDDSLQVVFDSYIRNRVTLKASTIYDYQQVMRKCFADWLPLSVTAITRDMVGIRYRVLIADKSESYVKKGMRTLQAILNSSDLTTNPVASFLRVSGTTTSSVARHRFLRSGEIQKVLELGREEDGTANRFGELMTFYLLTGCRRTEALSLKKTDYVDETITFRETKNGRIHQIPAYGWIKPIIEGAIASSDTDMIFPYSISRFRTKLKRFQDHLGLEEHWTTHDLRRTFAEHCQLTGLDVNVIASALNHSPSGITQNYYLGGGLAKLEMLRDVYAKLQRQYRAYLDDVGDVRLR